MGAPEPETCLAKSDLQGIIDAWPTLTEAVRAAIVAMVKAKKQS